MSQNPSQPIKLLESGADDAKFKRVTAAMTYLPRAQWSVITHGMKLGITGQLSFCMTQFLTADCTLKTLTWAFKKFLS